MSTTIHAPVPTDMHPWDGTHPASATCSACGQPLVWRRQAPDPVTAAPRGAYEHRCDVDGLEQP